MEGQSHFGNIQKLRTANGLCLRKFRDRLVLIQKVLWNSVTKDQIKRSQIFNLNNGI